MRLYICLSTVAHAHYVALSVFHDVFGDAYTKPIYIEKNAYTAVLKGKCQERRMLDRDFYSLIKTPQGVYRFNADIYRDAHQILGLPIEEECGLAFRLMSTRPSEIQTVRSPRQAYLDARTKNPRFESIVSFVLKHVDVPEQSLGLIGSLAIDPTLESRDVDLVFTDNVSVLNVVSDWIQRGPKGGAPLQRVLPAPLPIVCAFFNAQPIVYPDLSELRVLQPTTEDFELVMGNPICPPYLNMQIYHTQIQGKDREMLLIIRDSLSRVALKPGMRLRLSGHPSIVRGKSAILVTDVEQQLPEVPFHGGGTICSYPNGAKKQS